MSNLFHWLFDTSDFMPRRECGNWSESLILVHNVADLAIFLSYFCISVALAYVVLKHRNIQFPKTLSMFALFIISCGATHLMDYIVFFLPIYKLGGVVKVVTAAASFLAAVCLIPIIPKVMSMKLPAELEAEISRRQCAEDELRQHKEDLQGHIAEQTKELRETNLLLREQIEARQKISNELAEQAKALVEIQKTTVHTCAILDSMMQLAPVGLGFFDPECRYIRANDHLAALNGRKPSEHIGKTIEEVLGPLATQVKPHLREVLHTAKAVLNEESSGSRPNKPGKRIWLTSYYPVFTPEGGVLGVGVVVNDITDRKLLEMELRKRVAELAENNKQKNDFLATLAHELRNPLAPIANSIYMLEKYVSKDKLQEVGHIYEVMQRQIKHMTRLLDDLLDLARLNRGKIVLRNEPIDINECVKRCVELHRSSAETRNHEVRLRLNSQPLVVNGDPTRLEQIISNLLTNAIKYTEPGGLIELRTSLVDNTVVVNVKDNGIGITPQTLPKLFEIFAQASHSLDRAQGGLGIGLSLSRYLARLHNGEITAYSEGLGHGSEFALRLPLLRVQSLDDKAFETKVKIVRQLRVLVVDDNQDAANSLAMVLRHEGHDTVEVYDGTAALKKVHTYNPEVILLDIGLPGLDGFTCCELLRESGFKNVIIAVTGYGSDADKIRSAQAGFNSHLTKPVDLNSLITLLNEHTSKDVS